jgi:hypothetical protein
MGDRSQSLEGLSNFRSTHTMPYLLLFNAAVLTEADRWIHELDWGRYSADRWHKFDPRAASHPTDTEFDTVFTIPRFAPYYLQSRWYRGRKKPHENKGSGRSAHHFQRVFRLGISGFNFLCR